MHAVENEDLGNLPVELPIKDVSDKLMLTEHFGTIKLDGETITIARSIHGLHFTLDFNGHQETVDLNPVFRAWAPRFIERAMEASK